MVTSPGIQAHEGEQVRRGERLRRGRHALQDVVGELTIVAALEPEPQVARAQVHDAADLDVRLTVARAHGEQSVGPGAAAGGESDQAFGRGPKATPLALPVPAIREREGEPGLGVAAEGDFGIAGLDADGPNGSAMKVLTSSAVAGVLGSAGWRRSPRRRDRFEAWSGAR